MNTFILETIAIFAALVYVILRFDKLSKREFNKFEKATVKVFTLCDRIKWDKIAEKIADGLNLFVYKIDCGVYWIVQKASFSKL